MSDQQTCAPAATGSNTRGAARRAAWNLLRHAQLDGELTVAMVDDLIASAQTRGWSDVVLIGRYLAYFRARYLRGETGATELAALCDQARADGDDVMLALALACRAQGREGLDGGTQFDSDRDLAQATALIDRVTGRSTEAVCARIECAYACGEREMWEEQLAHLTAAERLLDPEECAAEYLEVLLLNRAEVELYRLMALRETGPGADLAAQAEASRQAVRAALALEPPRIWRDAMLSFEDLIDGISSAAGARREPRLGVLAPGDEDPADGRYGGYVHLARAFRETDHRVALALCERAMQTPDPEGSDRVRLLALALAVELEPGRVGEMGLRWGRELLRDRDRQRAGTRASIDSLIVVESAAAEHAELKDHAHRDELTGLANRRALARAVGVLGDSGVERLAVVLLDLDDFKTVNDRYGHAVGDAVLIRIAEALRCAVREEDLVVRLGGDEFLILLEGAERPVVDLRVRAIESAVRDVDWNRLAPGLSVSASAGLALGSPDAFTELRDTADTALYEHKRARRRQAR